MGDEGLCARAAAGDGAAFRRLVELHQSALRGFLLRLARGDRALADDLAQETFLEAWRKIRQYRGAGAFRSWLTRIAFTRYLMEARRRKLEPLDETADTRQPEGGLDPGVRFDLERAMARLPAAERAALTLCYAQEYSNEEAAEILGMPLGTLKSNVLRGRKRLLSMLEGAP